MTDYTCTWWKLVGQTDWIVSTGDPSYSYKKNIFENLITGQTIVGNDLLPVGALYVLPRDDDDGPNDFPPVGIVDDALSIGCVIIGDSGPDSRSIWYIDNRASNCTLPDDDAHRCWVRHGTVGEKLTVDKVGLTCAAGAGSFFMNRGAWHGFLRNGVLVEG